MPQHGEVNVRDQTAQAATQRHLQRQERRTPPQSQSQPNSLSLLAL